MKPIYFDLTVKDLSASRKFLEKVLGWKFKPFPMSFDYLRIEAGAVDEQGIDGGIGAAGPDDAPMVALTMEVPDLDAMAEKIVASGGRLVGEKLAIPGIGWHLSFAEPGGLVFGLLQPDETAQPG